MSGGSHNYVCFQIEQELVGQMHDLELDDLMKDIAELAHDLEWYDSSDIGETDYRNKVNEFKNKWCRGNRTKRLKTYIDNAIKETHDKLYALVGIDEAEKSDDTEWKPYMGAKDVFCPLCNHSTGSRGHKLGHGSTLIRCKHCKCEFTVHYFVEDETQKESDAE